MITFTKPKEKKKRVRNQYLMLSLHAAIWSGIGSSRFWMSVWRRAFHILCINSSVKAIEEDNKQNANQQNHPHVQ